MQTHGFAIKLKYVGTVLVQSFLVLFFSTNTQALIRPLHPGYPPAPPRSWREEKRLEKRWFSKTLLFLSLPYGCTSEDHKTFDRLKQYVICVCGGHTRGDRCICSEGLQPRNGWSIRDQNIDYTRGILSFWYWWWWGTVTMLEICMS